MQRLLKRHSPGTNAYEGPDDRSVLLRETQGLVLYDIDLEPVGPFEADSQPHTTESELGRKHRRHCWHGDGIIEFVTQDRRSIASYPFDHDIFGVYIPEGFDRSGEGFWGASNTPYFILHAIEVATGRIHETDLDFADRIWLLPDWGVDHVMWICIQDCQASAVTTVSKHTMGTEYVRGPWTTLKTGAVGRTADGQEPSLDALHCQDGKLIVLGGDEHRLWTYDLETGQVIRGPLLGDGRVKLKADEIPASEYSFRDHFAVSWKDCLIIHDASTLETLAVIPYPAGNPIFLSENRVVVSTREGVELWQL